MPTVVYTEVLRENVLLGFSDGTSKLISRELAAEIVAELSGLFNQSTFTGGQPN